MKINFLITLLSLTLLSLLLTNCSTTYKLGYNLEKGKTYNQNYEQESAIKLMISDTDDRDEMKMNLKKNLNISFLVLEKKDTYYDMEIRYNQIEVGPSMMSRITYSSDSPNSSDEISKLLNLLTNGRFNAKMNFDGKIHSIEWLDKMIIDAVEKLADGNADETGKASFVKYIKSEFGKKAFQKIIESGSFIFPKEEISINSTWVQNTDVDGMNFVSPLSFSSQNIDVDSGLNLVSNNTYKLIAADEEFATIVCTGTMKTKEDTSQNSSELPAMYYNMEGKTKSEYKINIKTGWVVESKSNSIIEGKATLPDNTQMPEEMEMGIEIVSDVTVKGK